MTELIPGKRYLMKTEVEVMEGGCLNAPGLGYLSKGWIDKSIFELIPDPLPTTPGSVIHLSGHGYLMRRYPSAPSALTLPWVDSEGHSYSDNSVDGADAIFDAGAERA